MPAVRGPVAGLAWRPTHPAGTLLYGAGRAMMKV